MQFVADKAAALADTRLAARENRWRAVVTVLFAVLALLGYKDISSIRSDTKAAVYAELRPEVGRVVQEEIQQYLERNSARLIGQRIESTEKALRTQITMARLIQSAYALDRADSYTDEERDAVIDLLREAATNQTVAASKDFGVALKRTLGSLIAADQEYHVERLENELRESIQASAVCSEQLLKYLAIKVLGRPDPNPKRTNEFAVYLDICEHRHRLVAPCFFRMLHEHSKPGSSSRLIIAYQIDRTAVMSPQKQQFFLALVDEFCRYAGHEDSVEMRRTGELALDFTAQYSDSIRARLMSDEGEETEEGDGKPSE